MNVVSMFDGVSCGRLALDIMGIKVKQYYAYEIELWPILCSGWHWPDITQCGSVVGADFTQYENIDLLIGGSPCQGFSFAGKQLNFDDPRSILFFEYVRALKELRIKNPNIKFLLENVAMKQQYQDIISEALGVKPVKINSKLVSAQSRPRLYWTNIAEIAQPEDRGIMLSDILEIPGYGGRVTGRRINTETGKRDDYNYDMPIHQVLYLNKTPNKSNCLTTVDKDNIVLSPSATDYIESISNDRTNYDLIGKCDHVTASFNKGIPYGVVSPLKFLSEKAMTYMLREGGAHTKGKSRLERYAVTEDFEKSYCLTASGAKGVPFDVVGVKDIPNSGNRVPSSQFYQNIDGYYYRGFTMVERERLQGWPDGYTEMMPKTHAIKALGNGWQVDTIIYILSHLLLEDLL